MPRKPLDDCDLLGLQNCEGTTVYKKVEWKTDHCSLESYMPEAKGSRKWHFAGVLLLLPNHFSPPTRLYYNKLLLSLGLDQYVSMLYCYNQFCSIYLFFVNSKILSLKKEKYNKNVAYCIFTFLQMFNSKLMHLGSHKDFRVRTNHNNTSVFRIELWLFCKNLKNKRYISIYDDLNSPHFKVLSCRSHCHKIANFFKILQY